MPAEPAILAVAADYPSDAAPARGTFVHRLMREWGRTGARTSVIAPEPRFSPRRRLAARRSPGAEVRDGVAVSRPRYFSISNRILPLGFSLYPWTVAFFVRSALGVRQESAPDICYGHFLYPAGIAAQRLSVRHGARSAVALGESSFAHYERHFGIERIRSDLAKFSRLVAVSEQNAQVCVERYLVTPERIRVFPNAVDRAEFLPLDRAAARSQLGLPPEQPIVAFVGHMVERKGPNRVMEAVSGLPGVGAVFLGEGPLKPGGPAVIFAGAVSHDRVPVWLNAADVFALPSLAEGWSNAILEALACGLPVVASDRPFNSWLRGSSAAELVDPEDPPAIRAGIAAFLNDPQRSKAARRDAVALASRYSIRDRASNILDWIRSGP